MKKYKIRLEIKIDTEVAEEYNIESEYDIEALVEGVLTGYTKDIGGIIIQAEASAVEVDND